MSGSASTTPTTFVDNTPGSTSITLAPGTYDIIATGGGMNRYSGAPGGTGAVVESTFTFTAWTIVQDSRVWTDVQDI